MNGNAQAIEWRSVSKRFGARRALDGLTVSVGRGELFGFLGPNGAGKTTALRIVTGLVRPDDGEALLDGIVVSRPESRRRVVYLPEEIRFAAGVRLDEWLTHQVALRGRGEERIAPALERVGLHRHAPARADSLSKGMRRRAALALLLAVSPSIWLLDEPTADLDVEGRDLVEEILLEGKGKGATIFFSSHILSDVERVCDRVGVIDGGKLVRSAPPASFLPEPFLVELTLERLPEDAASFAAGRTFLLNTPARRLRVFVATRAEGEAVAGRLEEGGYAVARSTFRPASLRDAIGSLLS